MPRVIQTINAPGSGTNEISDQSVNTSPGRITDTVVSLSGPTYLEVWRNIGAGVHGFKADGRTWFHILSGAPSSPVIGDMWLEGTSGSVSLKYYDGVSTIIVAGSGANGNNLTFTAASALIAGAAVYANGTGCSPAVATAGSPYAYRVIGISNGPVLMSATATILIDGETLTLGDWSVLTGSATLTPNAPYFLTSTPGRYSTTVPAVASQVGIALSTTEMLVKTGLIVIAD